MENNCPNSHLHMHYVSTAVVATGTDYDLIENVYEGLTYSKLDYEPFLTKMEILGDSKLSTKYRVFSGVSYDGKADMTEECDANGVLNMHGRNMAHVPTPFIDAITSDPVLLATGILDRILFSAGRDWVYPVYENTDNIPQLRLTYVNLRNRNTGELLIE
uniref:Uncharacterized protein n=1 Tax=viral metagenome TaxID=1070528 RepID=A0A6C0LZI2_9ZZZZ